MKKMKFVTKGLALLLMGVMLAGCGDAASEKDTSEVTQESAETSKDAEGSKETEQESAREDKSSEASKEEEKASGEKEVSTEASKETTVTEVSSEQDSLVKTYEDYLKTMSFEGKQLTYDVSLAQYGVDGSFSMRFGTKDGVTFMHMGIPTGTDGKENSFTLYILKDSSAYLDVNCDGMDAMKIKTKSLSEENASSLDFTGGLTNLGSGDENVKLIYDRQSTEGGNTLDVLKIEQEQSVKLVFNRETKELLRFEVEESGQSMNVLITDLDSVELPAGLASAKEVDEEEFSTQMMSALMILIFSAGGMNLD